MKSSLPGGRGGMQKKWDESKRVREHVGGRQWAAGSRNQKKFGKES